MADVNSLFDCFDEVAPSEASVQFPNIKKEDDVLDASTANSSAIETPNLKRLHDEVEDIEKSAKKQRQEDDDDSELTSDINLELLNARIVIHTLETHEGCTHEVAIPPNHEYAPLVANTAEPAKQYAFILDPFQKEAIMCIDNLQSVLVSAHTSAGKTVVADSTITVVTR